MGNDVYPPGDWTRCAKDGGSRLRLRRAHRILNVDDAHHADAVALVRESLTPGTRRMLSAVNDSETLIGPITAGKDARDHVEAMLASFSIEIMIVDGACARRAAAVRARTNLELPDAYALATAIHAEHNGHDDVRLTSFDKAVLRAHADLHPN